MGWSGGGEAGVGGELRTVVRLEGDTIGRELLDVHRPRGTPPIAMGRIARGRVRLVSYAVSVLR